MQLRRVFQVLVALAIADFSVPCSAVKTVQTQASHQKRQAPSPVLSQFLKELKSEASVSAKQANEVAQWCKEAREQKATLAATLNHQLREASSAASTLAGQEKGLRQQAQEAKSVVDAGENAADVAVNIQNKNKKMELQNAIRAVRDELAMLQSGSGQEERAQQLLGKLKQLYEQMSEEEGQAKKLEQQAKREHLQAQHLSDAASAQVKVAHAAALATNVAHSKREQARLKSRVAGITTLLRAVNASSLATEDACAEEEKHHAQVAAFINAETTAATDIIKQLSANSEAQENHAVAFLQVSEGSKAGLAVHKSLKRLRHISDEFPDESAWYTAELQKFEKEQHVGASLARMSASAPAASDDVPSEAGTDDQGSSEGSAAPVTTHGSDMDAVQSLFSRASAHAQGKARMADQERARCHVLLQDAARDNTELQQSLASVAAKLQSAQKAMVEYQQIVQFDTQQRLLVESSQQDLKRLAEESAKEITSTSEAMKLSAQRLVSLASDMEQAQESEASSTKDLLQKVEEHEALLTRRAQRFATQTSKVDAANHALTLLLDADATSTRRSLARTKAEADLLTARAHAKADNHVLSGRFEHLANNICNEERMTELKSKKAQFKQEEEELINSAPQAS